VTTCRDAASEPRTKVSRTTGPLTALDAGRDDLDLAAHEIGLEDELEAELPLHGVGGGADDPQGRRLDDRGLGGVRGDRRCGVRRGDGHRAGDRVDGLLRLDLAG